MESVVKLVKQSILGFWLSATLLLTVISESVERTSVFSIL